jgi:hypothetical protein
VISTIHGDMEEESLVRSDGSDKYIADAVGSIAVVQWVEYRLPESDEILHRSAYVSVTPCGSAAQVGDF